jgi:hypothetical protein
MIDAGPEHADDLGRRPAAGHGPVNEANESREQPVVKSQIGAEVRQRPRVRFLGAQPHCAQPVGTQGEDHLLPFWGDLSRPAQPGMAAVERRVVIQLRIALYRGQRPHVYCTHIEGPRIRGTVQEPGHQLFLGNGSEHFKNSGLSQVVSPGATAAGGLVPEGRVGYGLDDVAVGKRQPGSRRSHEAQFTLPGNRSKAVDAGKDLRRPRVPHRTLARSHRTAGQDRKQHGRGIGRQCGGGQQKPSMDLSDGQEHSLAIPQAGRLMLRAPCI